MLALFTDLRFALTYAGILVLLGDGERRRELAAGSSCGSHPTTVL